MRLVSRAYDGLIIALVVAGAASLGLITLAIVADVLMRNIAGRPFIWTSAAVEYVMLFATMAGSPWLVRTGGHVAITTFIERLGSRIDRAVGRAVIVACALIAALLSWRSFYVALEEWHSGAVDIRSINIPGWLAYVFMGAGFALMAIEFCRLIATGAGRAGSGRH